MARAQQTIPASRKTQAKAGAGKRTNTPVRSQGQAATNRMTMKKQAARTASTSATPVSTGAGRTTPAKKRTAKQTKTQREDEYPSAGAAGLVRAPANSRLEAKRKRSASSPVSSTGQALIPIRTHQNRSQIIAAVAADTGVQSPIVDRVARSLSMTLTRHLVRNGSGRVEIPYLNAALYVSTQAAQKARTMMSPILGRNVTIPARKAKPVARFRPHSVLREIVART